MKKIEIISNQDIAGTATLTMLSDNTPSLNFSGGSSRKITLDCGNTNVSSLKTFFIMLPAGTQKISMKFYDATGKFMKKTISGAGSSGVSLARNNIYELGTVNFNATEVDPEFSVSSTKKVLFSQGNLQYQASTGTWRFAEHQYDYVGDATNGTVYAGGVKCDNALISSTYTGWTDLFGWGTSGWNSGAAAYQPYETNTSDANYYPGGDYHNDLTGTYANADWGVYNQIGSDTAGTWRTLTEREWAYLLGISGATRGGSHTSWWVYSMVTIQNADGSNNITGLLIYPDGTTSKPSGITAGLTKNNKTAVNISKAEFDALEYAGYVFLPCTGYRENNTIKEVDRGHYWSSTHDVPQGNNETYSRGIDFYSPENRVEPKDYYNRKFGLSVRLVKDAN